MTSTGAADSPNSERPWSLGDRLRVSRCSARLTIRDMGQRLGVASEVVNGYERELTPVPDAVVTAYADVTGVSQDWIRTGAGDPPPLHGDGS